VTTLTQLSVAAIPLAVAFGLLRRRSLLPLVIVILTLAVVRSFVFSERLALLELAVPLLYLGFARRVVVLPKAVLVALAAGVAVLLLFAVTEARRSYVYTQNFSVAHVTARFFGYYVTSENNAVVVSARYPAGTPLAYTGAMFWSFPLVSQFHAEDTRLGDVTLRYEDLFGFTPKFYWESAFAESGLNSEYNVFTTPGFLAADFGWAGLFGLAFLGVVSGALWKRARTTSFHRAFYAVWLVGLLEFMRIMYFFDTRALPAYVVFVLVYLLIARRARVLGWTPTYQNRTPLAGADARVD
jgi:oligosaccharide repeat unit polymerase